MAADGIIDDDLLLSAYLDGELPAEQASVLSERLAREPALAARLDALRRVNTGVESLYADIVDEPVPAPITALLQPERASVSAATVVPMRRRYVAQLLTVPAAMAAGVALAFGFLLAYVLAPQLREPGSPMAIVASGLVDTGTPLHSVLEGLPSGQSSPLDAHWQAMPRLSFRTVDGTVCRHVDLSGPDDTTSMLACLRPDGWRIELASFAGPAYRPADDQVFRPASGPGGTAFEQAIDELIDGDPLGAAEELQLIADRWQQTGR